MSMFSLQIEKHVIGGLLKNPEVLADIEPFVSEKDFYNKAHSTIFKVIKNSILTQENIDSVLVAQKIKDCGAANSFKESFGNDVSIFDYIDNLSYIQISKKGVVEAAKQLVSFRIKRELLETTEDVKKLIKTGGEKSATELIGEVDTLYHGRITSYSNLDDKPADLFDGLSQELNQQVEKESAGFLTPFSEFNRLYGGFRPGNVYCFAARPGQGKTTFLNNTVFRTALKYNIPVLFIDTEMERTDIRKRMLSALSGIPLHYIETGKFKRNKEAQEKVMNASKKLENIKFPCHHYSAGRVSTEQIMSKIRRWMLSDVGRGNPAIISYDYLKLTGEKVGQNWAEYQVMGEKVSALHQISVELGVPIITAVQSNRTAENFNRRNSQVTNDSSAIAISDRIQWFCSFTAGFTRKTIEEIALDEGMSADEAENLEDRENLRFGTHKMTVYKSRFQGENAPGHHDLLRRVLPDASVRYENNYLNFNISNFGVTEMGSLESIIDSQRERHTLDDERGNDGELL